MDGGAGVVVAPGGRLVGALRLTLADGINDGITDGRVAAVEVVTDPTRLAALEAALLEG